MSYLNITNQQSINKKNESINYNTQDYLNQNSIIKHEKDDLFKLLKLGIPKKRKNSLFDECENFHSNILNVGKFQDYQIDVKNSNKTNENNEFINKISKDDEKSINSSINKSIKTFTSSSVKSERNNIIKSSNSKDKKISQENFIKKNLELYGEKNFDNIFDKNKKNESPKYNLDSTDEINELLNFRELEKIKLNKRRQSINIKTKTQNEKRKNSQIGTSVANLKMNNNSKSTQGRYKIIIKYIDILIAFAVCINIGISIIENEIYISKSDKYIQDYLQENNIIYINLEILAKMVERPISSEENILRFINIILSLLNIVLIYFHYILKIKLLQQDHKLSEYDNIFTSGLYKYCGLEMLICGLFYPPYLNTVISGNLLNLLYIYNLNAILSFVVMLKSYIILRVYSYFSRWTSDAANSVCNKYKVRPGIHFAIKAELKKRPYTMLTIMMLVSLTILSFALRTFEYGVKDPEKITSLKGDNDLQSLINCFWLIIVTMTTVGYGDLYPKSHLGRFIGVIACIIGMLIVSLIVVSLAVIAEFTLEEKKAYSLLKKLQVDDKAYNKAINVMIGVLKLRKLVHKNKNNKLGNNLSEKFILVTTLRKEISVFKNDYKIANSYLLPVDEMLKKLESKLKNDIHQLTANIKKLINVEGDLDRICSRQDIVMKKINVMMGRQEKIGKYLIDLNNRNYKKFIIKSMRKSEITNIYNVINDSNYSKKLTKENEEEEINNDNKKLLKKENHIRNNLNNKMQINFNKRIDESYKDFLIKSNFKNNSPLKSNNISGICYNEEQNSINSIIPNNIMKVFKEFSLNNIFYENHDDIKNE